MFIVEFSKDVEKDISKLNKNIADEILDILKRELSNNPTTKGKIIGKSIYTGLIYWEKRFYRDGGFRAYYTIVRGVITIEKIEYEGRVNISRITKKKEQKQTLKYLGIK